MKYVKMLGLAAIAAMALMAFVGAGSASADELCENETGACTQVNSIESSNEGVVKLTTSFKTIECSASSVAGSITEQGAGKTIKGNISTLTFTTCNCEVKVLKNGTLSATNITSTNNGTVSSNGAEVTASCSTIIGTVHCIYETKNTHLGVLTGGKTAVLHAEEAEIPRLATSAACAEKAKWDATYKVTKPDSLFVRHS